MTEIVGQTEIERDRRVFDKAYELFSTKPTWVEFFREVLGVGGIVRTLYPSPVEMAEFERTETYEAIQEMLAELRENPLPTKKSEATRVITVRLPKSVHDLLRTEAYDYRTSMNKLCISKLLQIIDAQLVPDNTKERETGADPEAREDQ